MKKMLLTLIGILAWSSAQTCDCYHEGNFVELSKNVDAIFIIRVDGYNDFFARLFGDRPPRSATFEIIKTLKGVADEDEITVFGDSGALCRPYINMFKEDQYYVVSLYKCNGYIDGESEDDFFISACGEYWLDYNPTSKTVTGLITTGATKPSTIKLATFEKLLKAK